MSIAAVHPADTRLLVAVLAFGMFVVMLPRPAPRPMAAAVLVVIVALWSFGATLIWGTGGPTKLRIGVALSRLGGSTLLACAMIGIVAAAAALRSFAHGDKRSGTRLAVLFAVAFGAWSATVRYSPVIAVLGLITAAVAFRWAATMPADREQSQQRSHLTAARTGAARLRILAGVVLSLSGPAFYAWLQWGPKSWIDPACGASLVLPAFIISVGTPAIVVGLTSRAAGKRTEVVAAAAIITILAAGAMCVLAFLLWFGQHKCGE